MYFTLELTVSPAYTAKLACANKWKTGGNKIESRPFPVNLLLKCAGCIGSKIFEAYYIINYKPPLSMNT